ncbi:MBL fold metallo-hydrolase [Ureibacillus acetophenoni]|uniref:Glyoxylase-like metal-dependent hydrolase (Beta-lactamase superfamily II) n=1 Tax=Ureibacillus acetophenoni TaxID=614649 RepID=A0A285U2E9_9BACL|nr:MBL fold metallo-hydrolase [Ureibacillus acetophenoni]SOC35999.1 glyoxylase-like metal-dependent hydrolase (beta-lactamase superfamily II) [Ureibacillus acetophenoni]
MDIHKIVIPTPYDIGDVNAFLVKGEALSLFDAGPKTKEAYEALKEGISAAGYNMNDIEQVVLTHHHPDHAGWGDAFPNAKILGHEYVDQFLRKSPEFLEYRNEFYRYHLKRNGIPEIFIEKYLENRKEMNYFGSNPLTHCLKEGDEVPGHPGMKVVYTPGHAQSHFIFHDEKTNSVIGGDLLLDSVASNPLIEPPIDLSYSRPKALLQYRDSLIKLRDLRVNKVYAGHGNDIDNVSELINLRLQRDYLRAKQVYELLNEPKTVIEITKSLYSTIYKTQLGLTLSKAIGYLDLLESKGMVTAQLVDDINVFSRT